jgi:hypothetical protein
VNCILVELTDGSIRAYAYPDDESAESWYRECRAEWNAGRNLIFYLRPGYGASYAMHAGDSVTHLELEALAHVKDRGIDYREAVVFG